MVSIHAPRMGRDMTLRHAGRQRVFQFTRPAWGATVSVSRVPDGARVSIHAPRMGRDLYPKIPRYTIEFQFTRPAWGATKRKYNHDL